MDKTMVIPGAGCFLFPGSKTGCLLLHGFTSMPEEVRDLGTFLNQRGYTVLGVRLAGHATHPADLMRTNWEDWLVSVEDALAVLHGLCERVVIIGQSMGGVIALLSAARYTVDGVVAISTPYDADSDWRMKTVRLWSLLLPEIFKGSKPRNDELAGRREIDYPSYPSFPTRIIGEVEDLKAAMRAEIGKVNVPVLVIQSRADDGVLPANAEHLFAEIKAAQKEMFWLEKAGHSIVCDPEREVAFEKIASFLAPFQKGT